MRFLLPHFLACSALVAPASSEVLVYVAKGRVLAHDVDTGPWRTLKVGDAFDLTVFVDANATPSLLLVGQEFLDAVLDVRLSAGQLDEGILRPSAMIRVQNDDQGIIATSIPSCTDQLFVQILDFPGASLLELQLHESSGQVCSSALSSLDLPTAIDITQFSLRRVLFRVGTGNEHWIGDITSFDVHVLDPVRSICVGDAGGASACGNCPCGNDSPPSSGAGCLNSTGVGATLSSNGLPSMGHESLQVELSDATPNSLAILIAGSRLLPAQGPCPSGSGLVSSSLDGLRCVGGGTRRIRSVSTDSFGAISALDWLSLDAGAASSGWVPLLTPVPGETQFVQVLYREFRSQSCQTGLNSSNALSLRILL